MKHRATESKSVHYKLTKYQTEKNEFTFTMRGYTFKMANINYTLFDIIDFLY